MHLSVSLKQFDGPLDLLLSLITSKELDISEIALGEVTEQFLVSIDQLDEAKPELLADFLVVASRLLVMKSRSLLPQFAPEEEDGPGLAEQLKLYKAFVEASKVLAKQWDDKRRSYFRVEPPQKHEEFVPPENVETGMLRVIMVQLVKRLAPSKPLPQVQIDRTISIKQRIKDIRVLLKKKRTILFSDLLANEFQNKSEVIVGFLALLELVKQQQAMLKQDEMFGDITVRAV